MVNPISPEELESITSRTLNHYDGTAESFWEGTKEHDVTQNYVALLSALPQQPGLRILDLGCGPGRDLHYFKSQGHSPTGLDGSAAFCKMAEAYSGCPVLHRNFLSMGLAPESFDGIFANASLFHVPRQELERVLVELHLSLAPGGVLFSSNPRGESEGWSGDRYGSHLEWPAYESILMRVGFEPLHHYYRPAGLPLEQQPWLAAVSRKIERGNGA